MAACLGGIETELHRVKAGDGHFSGLDPESASWAAAEGLLHRGLGLGLNGPTRSSLISGCGSENDPRDTPSVLPTIRYESDTEVVIQTRLGC